MARARGTTPPSPDEMVETVAASALNVGDRIFFPNSRHAQEITSIVNNDGVLTVATTDTMWNLGLDHEVRREVKAEAEA